MNQRSPIAFELGQILRRSDQRDRGQERELMHRTDETLARLPDKRRFHASLGLVLKESGLCLLSQEVIPAPRSFLVSEGILSGVEAHFLAQSSTGICLARVIEGNAAVQAKSYLHLHQPRGLWHYEGEQTIPLLERLGVCIPFQLFWDGFRMG